MAKCYENKPNMELTQNRIKWHMYVFNLNPDGISTEEAPGRL